ncbi:adenylate/guanylate cyclase family protein [Humibacillus xanthopallidus]|uniref:Adenylate/guanylate cyclase family protein n=1 Tax=Humibacillus xanthopallidus TaxID=412689 RepID=A0A543PUC0_9MICO|nr:adenylate/guanylate cyclase domain-containing protein [Humibacillus xanthopallidus]TQN47669.1 adenylate/guanylate cyclase family protein [Humibacillus xanthopallidus]
MDSNHKAYDHLASFGRIDEILAQPQGNFEEKKSLPDRDTLTYTNGFYAYCSAVFIDIRDSSKLPTLYNRPALARLYRAFISEMVAVLNSDENAREINIVGDCVWAVFNTSTKPDLDTVYTKMCTANSLLKVLNYKLSKKGYSTPITIGIGASYGRALMIKAGYNGSGLADVVYMGDVVNQASKLAAKGGGAEVSQPMVMDGTFRQNLNDHNKALTAYDPNVGAYTSNAIIKSMNDWYTANCN